MKQNTNQKVHPKLEKEASHGQQPAPVAGDKSPKDMQDDIAATYNAFKNFEGKLYTGVKIGRGHKWYYDSGEWKERKVTPEKWEFTYAVNKRRAGKAPEGSGVPVGTEYHWYILAHQIVRKLDANVYSTAMTGMKHKLAHMRAITGKWSASEAAQRRHLIRILQEMIQQLQREIDAPAEAAELTQPAGPRLSKSDAPATKAPVRKSRQPVKPQVGQAKPSEAAGVRRGRKRVA